MNNKNLWLLIGAQMFFMITNMIFVSLAPLLGKHLLDNNNLATLPMAMTMLAMLIFSFPLSILMGKIGRAIVFKSGIVANIIAGFIFFNALQYHLFWLLLVGAVFFGYAISCANYYRFAAMEMVDESQRGKAMSKLMAVGVIAALIGPNLSSFSKDLYFDISFSSSVLSFMPLSIIALILMFFIKWPAKKAVATIQVKIKHEKTSRQVYKPILTAMVAYGVMVLIMSATPLHMSHHNYEFVDTAWVIQWHVLGMFAPSFFIGWLTNKLGNTGLLILGVLVLFASIATNLIATDRAGLTLGLLLLGVGWNFLFVGSSHWLMSFINDSNRSNIQGINEVLVFGLASVATLSSGWLINVLGWQALNIAALPLLCLLLIILLKTQFEQSTKLVIT
ncbi:MAG: MFS transporter [Pseudomonadales bacterium]|nr:MFS transporter [Pseudomonadales bacterium]